MNVNARIKDETRLISTDTTCFLATESIFKKETNTSQWDPQAVSIAASLFDAIVNASELRLCLAVSDPGEDLTKRYAESYTWLKAGSTEGSHDLPIILTELPNSIFDQRRAYVEAALESFMVQVTERPHYYKMMVAWLQANTQVGGVAKRPRYSMPIEYLTEFKHFNEFTSSQSGLSEEQWAYCFDFLMKHESYCLNSSGFYIPHTLRSILGLKIMSDARGTTPYEFDLVSSDISVSFREAIVPRLKARVIPSWEDFFNLALRTRAVVEAVKLHDLSHQDRAKARDQIADECGYFFPTVTDLQRDWSPIENMISQIKKTPLEVMVDIAVFKGVSATFGVDDNFGYKDLIAGLISLGINISRKTVPVAVPITKHLFIKGQGFFYSPVGAAFRVKFDQDDEYKRCALNADYINFGKNALIPGVVRSDLVKRLN